LASPPSSAYEPDMAKPREPTAEDLAERLTQGDRPSLARAITLAESKRPDRRLAARKLLEAVLPRTGGAVRVGITGVPGVGKSTAIDTLGTELTAKGHKVAVLAVDPSSSRTGGAILGDKTRMARLAADPNAFIRPSPASGTLGGVAAKTRETTLLCEAAGFDVILVETVGVGQSETAVADLTDFFLVLMLPGAGDELQGIKKGIVELADMIAVNKADGDGAARATAAAAEYRAALHILTPASPHWTPRVITVSGLTGLGLDDLWAKVIDHRSRLQASGELEAKRRAQDRKWVWALVHERLNERLRGDPTVRGRVPEIERAVEEGKLSPTTAADEIAGILGL
jgi:LAO/AO transport system kinase